MSSRDLDSNKKRKKKNKLSKPKYVEWDDEPKKKKKKKSSDKLPEKSKKKKQKNKAKKKEATTDSEFALPEDFSVTNASDIDLERFSKLVNKGKSVETIAIKMGLPLDVVKALYPKSKKDVIKIGRAHV